MGFIKESTNKVSDLKEVSCILSCVGIRSIGSSKPAFQPRKVKKNNDGVIKPTINLDEYEKVPVVLFVSLFI